MTQNKSENQNKQLHNPSPTPGDPREAEPGKGAGGDQWGGANGSVDRGE